MKKVFLPVVIIIFCTTVMAQENSYKGPAKLFVNSFWQMSKSTRELIATGSVSLGPRVDNMEKTIASVILRDPTYNTATMLKETKDLKELLATEGKKYKEGQEQGKLQKEKEQQEKEEQATSRNTTDKRVNELLALLFDASVGEHKPDNIKTKISAVKKNMQELLAMDMSNNTKTFATYLTRLKKYAQEAQGFYTPLAKNSKERTDASQVQVDFYMFQYYQAYWDAAQKLFPEETSLCATYSLATKILDELGSVDQLIALTVKNYEQKAEDTRLPTAKVKDAALEKLFIDAYNSMYSESFKGKAVKAIVVSDDWQIQRNDITGIVTGRLRKGAIVYKNTDGKCFLIQEFFIQQEYVGNSFVGTKSVYAVGKGQEMLCENVK